MVELMRGIYRLVRENGDSPIEVITKQGVVKIDPKQLPPRTHLEVNVAISPSEKSERAQKLISLKQMISTDQSLAPIFTLQQNRNIMAEICDLMGIKEVNNYLMPLEQLQPPQPNPAEQLQMAGMQAQVEFTQAQTQKVMADIFNDREKTTFEQQHAADTMHQKNLELQFKQEVSADEMTLANRVEDNRIALEQAKHNLMMQQQKVREYESTLRELEVSLTTSAEAQKSMIKINRDEMDYEQSVAELEIKRKAQEHAAKSLKVQKVSNKG